MLAYLQKNQGSAKYLVAVSGSQASAPIIIETGEAVVTMGGFSGSDNAPTVSQLQAMVAKGELKYVLLGGRGGVERRVELGAGARHRGGRLRGALRADRVASRSMIDHLALNVSDMAASRAFYEAALAPLGFGVVMEWEGRVAFGPTARPIFFIGRREPVQSGLHIAFQAADRDARRRVPRRRAGRRRARQRRPRHAPALPPALLRRLRPRPGRQQRRSRLPHARMTVTRGFERKRSRDDRLPPGQYLERGFPVLSAGPTPHTPLEEWTFELVGAISEPRSWTWEEFKALPREELHVDIHCVTTWSKLDTDWSGVSVDTLLDGARARGRLRHRVLRRRLHDQPAGRGHHRRQGVGRRTATTATRSSPQHGGPARLLVPHLYFWKSAKWVRGLIFTEEDEPGFWETLGYHDRGDPWLEQRYQGD